jgi:hypothetical protein
MDETLKPIVELVPPNWRNTVAIAIILLPYVTRGIYALSSGRGIVGAINSLLFGTNTPKE